MADTSTDFQKQAADDHAGKPLIAVDEYEGNPIGLPRDVAEPIARHLDRHLASLWALWHMYRKHHWLVKGPQFRDLHLFLEENYEEVAKDGDALAERMTAIGGVPTSSMAQQVKLTYISEEPEGYFPIRNSLRHDMHCEGTIAQNLRKTIKECSDGGDYGTERVLKKILLHAEDRAHHIEHFLEGDSLEDGRERE
jgi:DNA-binding ferritin-like protein